MKSLYLFFFLLGSLSAFSQIQLTGYQQEHINPDLFQKRWPAHWISVPGEPDNVFGVYHFRKTISLDQQPTHFYVHVSGDNRYKLFVNGQLASLGPAKGNLYNWNFETADLAPFLKKGQNVLAAVVWNFADYKPAAQISFNSTGFLLQGNGPAEQLVNTDASWLCQKDEAYTPWIKPVYGYYVAGPGESVQNNAYPWGWTDLTFNDTAWLKAKAGLPAAMKGSRDYPGRLLVPGPIPPMEMQAERLKTIRLQEGIQVTDSFLKGTQALTIPAHSKVRLLLDNQQLTTGYLSVVLSKGKGADVRIGYAEALYEDSRTNAKGNRNEVAGKTFVGYEDRILADGGIQRNVTSLWWRTYRYLNLIITTADEPLVLEDLYGTTSRYPFHRETTFSAPDQDSLERMLDIGWRTARLCANETYMDCPYYEQLQYFGDTRIQALITLYNTGDTRLVKNALEQGRQSMVADGITMSRYPSNLHQFISSFSLLWIGMGYDYWLYRGDEPYLKTLLPAHRNILSWYEQWLKPDYSLAYVPNWFFVDWASSFDYGEPPRQKEGNSAMQDILYLLTLDWATSMEEQFGQPTIASHYKSISVPLRKAIVAHYWDQTKGLFADTKAHNTYSQHVNALAVLANLTNQKQAVMQRVLNDKSLTQATIYFKYYVHQALSKAGMGDLFLDQLKIWKEQMALGLTTWAEQPEPSRSDCHAWSAGPNIEFFRIVLGIDSDGPGFRKVKIAPALGKLKKVSGSIPHPAGTLSVAYEVNAKGGLKAHFIIPKGIQTIFVWKGKSYSLTSGEQQLTL
ncbi:MAG: alpha-L-rhamnosidase C-terminal domain-containing protein [Siphonobacter sp.]